MIPADHFHDNGDGTAWLVSSSGYHEVTEVYQDRPCDKCRVGDLVLSEMHGYPPCDCIDGRHTFDIEVASGPAHVISWARVTPIATYRVSIVPGMVLPIYVKPSDGPETEPKVTIPGQTDQGRLLGMYWHYVGYPEKNPADIITLPSAAARDMWAVKLKVAS